MLISSLHLEWKLCGPAWEGTPSTWQFHFPFAPSISSTAFPMPLVSGAIICTVFQTPLVSGVTITACFLHQLSWGCSPVVAHLPGDSLWTGVPSSSSVFTYPVSPCSPSCSWNHSFLFVTRPSGSLSGFPFQGLPKVLPHKQSQAVLQHSSDGAASPVASRRTRARPLLRVLVQGIYTCNCGLLSCNPCCSFHGLLSTTPVFPPFSTCTCTNPNPPPSSQ